MTEVSRIKKLQEWRAEDFTESAAWRKRAMRNYRFYTAFRQWDQDDIDTLDAEGRPHLTIPLIGPIINTIVGHQIDDEQQFRLYPRRGGSAHVAALGTELLKHTMDDCDGPDHMTEVFLDGNCGGVGVIGIERSRQDDRINGSLLVRKKSPFSVLFDQNAAEYDFNESGRRVYEEKWMTAEEIKLGFKGVDARELQGATEDPRFSEERMSLDDDYADDRQIRPERRDQYLVNRCYWRQWQKNTYLVDLTDWSTKLLMGAGMIKVAKNALKVHILQMKELGADPTMAIIERAGWMLHETWFAGEKQLKHTENPWNGVMRFPYIPYYPYWADGYAFCPVDGLIDAQMEYNKRVSQELHILNTTANAGWMVKEAKDSEALKELKEHGAKQGFVLDESKFGGEAKKIEPNRPPVGHHLYAEGRKEDMNKIAGQDPNLRGERRGTESGKALERRFLAGMTSSRIVHRHFHRTSKIAARFLWDVIREEKNDIYSDQEIEFIVQEANLKEFIRPDESGRQRIDLSEFRSNDIGNYGIKVSTSPSAPTVRAENLDLLLRITEAYNRLYGFPVIPPDFIIELTDISRKEELIERLRTAQPVPQEQPQLKRRTA